MFLLSEPQFSCVLNVNNKDNVYRTGLWGGVNEYIFTKLL